MENRETLHRKTSSLCWSRTNTPLASRESWNGRSPEPTSNRNRLAFSNIIHNPSRGIQKKDLAQFTGTTWVEQAHNIVIAGPTGTGKTYLAEAIGLAACKLGYSARKVRYKSLFEEIAMARGTGTLLKHLKKIQTTKVLIIDDFLMGQASADDISNILEIVEERSQLGPLIVTTQFPIDQWHKIMPDPTIADAICDRLAHTATIFNLKGESMRKTTEKSQPK